MVTTAAGAIPIYYGILKYLSTGTTSSGNRPLNTLPPILFLAATLTFALAARPQLERAGRPEGQRRLDRNLRVATGLFVLGLLMGSLRFALALHG